MPNRISTVLDLDDKGFKGGLKSIGSAVGEAEGTFGKFKAGASAGLDVVKANIGSFAVAGAGALVAFGVKAVGAFTETAKAAIDLGTATGLSTEEASRWIGVGDDYEVTAEALATGLGKIGKTLDAPKWAKYGIATRDAGGHARSTNDILLDSFDTLSKITNATEQARVGQELFGKGYQSLTPILGHTRAEYEKMLGAVEKGQVITEAEAKKAERFRLAQDSLNDALHDVTIQIGEQVAGLAPLIDGMSKYITLVSDKGIANSSNPLSLLSGVIDDVKDAWAAFHNEGEKAQQVLDRAKDAARGYSYALYDVDQAQKAAVESVRNSTNSVEGYSYAVKSATDMVDEHKRHTQSMADDGKRNLDELKGKWDALSGDINSDQSLLNLQASFDDVKQKAKDAWDAAGKGADDTEQKVRDAHLATDDLKLSVIDYGKAVLGISPEQVTEFIAMIDQGQLDAVEAALNNLARNRTMSLDIVAKGGAGYSNLPHFDKGGVVPGPKGAPTLAVVHGGEEVVANGGNGGGGPVNVTINMPPGSNGDDVVRAIKKFEQRNGPGWRT